MKTKIGLIIGFFFVLCIGAYSGIVYQQSITSHHHATQAVSEPFWVTVYVHGTMTSAGIKLISKVRPEVGYGQFGLHHINQLDSASLFLKDVDHLVSKAPQRFNAQHFYTFGWSGSLSFKARKQAGQDLYVALQQLLTDYKTQYGIYPKLRIMTFSHGGNVALNMVSHLPFFGSEHVHLELLLIACPVQKVTEKMIEHDEIDRAYIIASTRDLLQVVDRYKYEKKRYFPSRFFDTKRKNCKQIKVLVNNRGLGHLDLLRSFMPYVPYVLDKADQCCACPLDDAHQDESNIVCCCIEDKNFNFYKGYNLVSCLYGQRKKEKLPSE